MNPIEEKLAPATPNGHKSPSQACRTVARIASAGAVLLLAYALGGCVMETGNGNGSGTEGESAAANSESTPTAATGASESTRPGQAGPDPHATTIPRTGSSGPWPWAPGNNVTPSPWPRTANASRGQAAIAPADRYDREEIRQETSPAAPVTR